ncbi:2Fe-2S iron-sulfur cluster-binding protein [Streptomyces sp. NPDC005438]|uniref:2Fe-2S iron-sulfur cluster-binding protein n=1 Tax=Streptomyces sp. NPDC005438 TaxID=3156880 RepID=UPI0033B42F38
MSAPRHEFHALRVSALERLTEDAVAVTLEVPEGLREDYRFLPGQHITLRRPLQDGRGEDVRRTYSLCGRAPAAGEPGPDRLTVGVRRVDGGVFSSYAVKELAAGDLVDVMPPMGRFTLDPAEGLSGHYAAVVGGSGITPVLSIARTLLARSPGARLCLVRGDRSTASTMFLEEVAELKDRYPDRFQLVSALSREEQQAGLPSGRLDRERLTSLLPALVPVESVRGWFLCGPLGLVEGTASALRELGVPRERVHQEVFHVAEVPARTVPTEEVQADATVAVTLDGRGGSWPSRGGESVLETVLRHRADAPFACKGGVCGTCRAFVVDGEVRMDRNYALEDDEVEAGYVLACQSHPVTEQVELDFDR